MQVTCQRCHQPIDIDEATATAMREQGIPLRAEHAPGSCPGEAPPAPAQPQVPVRYFEARLSLVEVFPDRKDNEELASFTAAHTGPSAADALAIGGPVMTEFASKWERLLDHIDLVDQPVATTPEPTMRFVSDAELQALPPQPTADIEALDRQPVGARVYANGTVWTKQRSGMWACKDTDLYDNGQVDAHTLARDLGPITSVRGRGKVLDEPQPVQEVRLTDGPTSAAPYTSVGLQDLPTGHEVLADGSIWRKDIDGRWVDTTRDRGPASVRFSAELHRYYSPVTDAR